MSQTKKGYERSVSKEYHILCHTLKCCSLAWYSQCHASKGQGANGSAPQGSPAAHQVDLSGARWPAPSRWTDDSSPTPSSSACGPRSPPLPAFISFLHLPPPQPSLRIKSYEAWDIKLCHSMELSISVMLCFLQHQRKQGVPRDCPVLCIWVEEPQCGYLASARCFLSVAPLQSVSIFALFFIIVSGLAIFLPI